MTKFKVGDKVVCNGMGGISRGTECVIERHLPPCADGRSRYSGQADDGYMFIIQDEWADLSTPAEMPSKEPLLPYNEWLCREFSGDARTMSAYIAYVDHYLEGNK